LISIIPNLDQTKYFKRFWGDLKATKNQKDIKNILSTTEKTLCDTWAKELEKIIQHVMRNKVILINYIIFIF